MTFMIIESSMAELGSNGFDPSHRRMVPSSSGSGPNDKRDVTDSPLLSFITCERVQVDIGFQNHASLVPLSFIRSHMIKGHTHLAPLKGAIILRPLYLRVWHGAIDDARQVVLHLGY